MKPNTVSVWFFAVVTLIPLGWNLPIAAQVAPDGSLSTTVTSTDNRNFVIENGDRTGSNLFHSFREFSVPTGGSATFNNAIDVQNIFGRVTGGSVSNIDGLIRANGRANLFLLNPNGIVLGSNAQLFIGGSFIGSTANRLRFSDGTIFDTSTASAPTLTVSVPAGLQFGNRSQIQVNGSGNQEIVPTTKFGLAVAPGQTFALVGGAVTFDGGVATAAAGRLEVGAVSQGEVQIFPSPVGWQFDYRQVEQFGHVQLLNRSSLWNPLSSVVGGVHVQGDRITVNNSQIAAVAGGNPAAGDFPGGNITLNAAMSLELSGANAIYPFSSWIVNQVAPGASNAGGQIQINTPQLNLQEGSRIQTLSQSSGSAGNIQINAARILIDGTAAAAADSTQQDLFNSRVTSDPIATGNGGNIEITAQRINLSNGGQISTLVAPQASGQGGEIRVNASERITARGFNPLNPRTSSGFVSITAGTGNGGGLKMSGDRITLSDGGVIQTQTLGAGRAGDILVRSQDRITARRISPTLQGGIGSYTFGSGNSGETNLSTNHLRLYEGANVTNASVSQSPGVSITGAAVPNAGSSGTVRINARQSIEIVGADSSTSFPAGIGTLSVTSGNSGAVDVSTRRLEVRQGGAIAAGMIFTVGRGLFSGVGTGQGGDVRVNASESIRLQGVDAKTRMNATINTYTGARGNAGTLFVQTPQLVVQEGATLGSVNSAVGQAGRVIINAGTIQVSGTVNQNPAEIFSTARTSDPAIRQVYNIPALPTGDSGTLTVNADRITVANGGRINVQHQGIGNAGQLRITTNTILLENQGSILAATASGQGGNVQVNVRDRFLLRDRSQIATTSNGNGNGGNIRINSRVLIGVNNSDIVAQARAGRGGNINITADTLLGITPRPNLTPESDINASSQLGLSGTINITNPNVSLSSGLIELPADLLDSNQQVAQTCANQDSKFVVTGRGGIPIDPTQALESDRPWSDLREFSTFEPTTHSQSLSPAAPLTEATEFRRYSTTGKLELVAAQPVQANGIASCSAAQ
jgi:filamentous hemagglutinin family protein